MDDRRTEPKMTKKLLILLACITIGHTAFAQGSVRIAGSARIPTITTATTSGTVAAGCRQVIFIFSADFTGTVLGATFAGANDSSVAMAAQTGDALTAIVYTVTAGNIRIVQVR